MASKILNQKDNIYETTIFNEISKKLIKENIDCVYGVQKQNCGIPNWTGVLRCLYNFYKACKAYCIM